MKWFRAVLISALIWVIIFVELSITMIGFKLSETNVWIVHYLLLIPIVILGGHLYYGKNDKTNGFLLGLFMLAIGIILDLIITVPLFIIPSGGNYGTYFSSIYMLAGFVEMVILFGFYGWLKR